MNAAFEIEDFSVTIGLEKARNLGAARTVVADADEWRIVIELGVARGNIAHGNRLATRDFGGFDFPWLADVEQHGGRA